MFLEFVEEWNSRRCPAQLYTGDFGRGGGGAAPRTSFAWGIKGGRGGRRRAADGGAGTEAGGRAGGLRGGGLSFLVARELALGGKGGKGAGALVVCAVCKGAPCGC